jgi:peptidyl-prolyl cis-trans isomerase D
MLDIMRRKKRLKAILWLVILSLALGMLLFFVPGANITSEGFDTTAASVDGDPIPMQDFLDAYRRAVNNYSEGGKNKTDPESLRSAGVAKQALDALINIRVINYASKQLGIEVSPDEVRQAVETHPNLQDQGGFIGAERYKALLAANSISITQFEEGLRYSLLARKIRNLVSDSLISTNAELRNEYLRTTEDAQIAFAVLNKDEYRKRISPTETELRAYFDAHKDNYRIKEQRRAQYLLFSLSALAATVHVTDQEVRQAWEKRGDQEMVDAAHILFEVKDAAKDAEVKAKAEAILKRAKAGEDFADLARKNSQDSDSAKAGGELGPFTRGKMVKEFENVAFALKPGEISDLVHTQFGYHIIKVSRHDKPTMESNRASIERGLQIDKAADLAKAKAAEAQRLAESQKDLAAIGKALGVPSEIKETGFLTRDSQPFVNGISQAMLDEIFRLKEVNAVGGAVDHPLGYAIPKLLETRLPKPPDFTESRAAVERDCIGSKASELVLQDAKALSQEAGKAGDLSKAAQKSKISVKNTAPFKRTGAADPDLATVPQATIAAFELPVGAVSPPILSGDGNRIVVLQVQSRTPFDEAAFNRQKPEIRDRIFAAWQDPYFEEYIRKITDDLEKRGKIRVNPKAMEQVERVQTRY